MQYLETGFLTFGHEAEVYHPNYIDSNDYVLVNRLGALPELSGCQVKRDGTGGIRAEVVFPPMADCEFTWQKYKEVFSAMKSMGCQVNLSPAIRAQRDMRRNSRNRAGGHVHIGTHKVMGISKEEFSIWSWNNFFSTGSNEHAHDTAMPFELIKDVIYRYANNQRFVDSMLPSFRRRGENSMINSIEDYSTSIRGASDRDDLASQFRGALKYHTVNVYPWTHNMGTVEFRQHHATLNMTKIRNWVRVLINMFHYSDSERLSYAGGSTIVHRFTPSDNPFRARTLKHTIWNCINTEGGMPSRDIMRICGVSYDNLRPRITEIRNHFQSDDIIRTITQQEYGNRYGTSGGRYDLNGYELNRQYTERDAQTSNQISVNYDIDDSILAGMAPDRIEYWNQMIIDRR